MRTSNLTPGLLILLFAISPDATPLLAQSTQKTKATPIAETPRSKRKPRPAAPNVCVQHTLTVDPATGDVKLKASFSNKDGKEKKFIFCQMVGISKKEVDTQAACDLFIDQATKKVKCRTTTRSFPSAMDAFHFGCRQVVLAPNEQNREVDYGPGQHDKFKGKKASDFFVTYADYVELPAGFEFDDTDCKNCFGKDKTTGLGPHDPQQSMGAMGDWYLPQLPFDDPFIQYQPLIGSASPPEYRSLAEPTGVPSNFPVNVAQLPRNVPKPVPQSYSVPLNLFDVFTMATGAPPTQASLTLTVTPALSGLFRTEPPELDDGGRRSVFTIPGGDERLGSITVLRPAELPEGAAVDLDVLVHEPDSPSGPGLALFSQKGRFIRDTSPPRIVDHSLRFEPGGNLRVQVTARDDTTRPLGAEFWYSTDNGASWSSRLLDPLSSLFDNALAPPRFTGGERSFAGDVGRFPFLTRVQYFVTAQDEVFNMVFFGVGRVALAPPSVNSASFVGPAVAPESIATLFGQGLATRTETAATSPPPTSLAETTVRITDSNGIERLAPLFFASPGQVNYQVPPGSAPGLARLSVTSGDGSLSISSAQITPVAPGVFTANSSGRDVAAALTVKARADGSQLIEFVFRCDAAIGRCVSVPIDLEPETDRVALVLFGTGIRFRSSASPVSVMIGGQNSEVLFAGAQGTFAGLDQINVLLPRSLVGRGEVPVVVNVDGTSANTVTINIR